MQSIDSLEQTLLGHLRQLPPEKQQEVLDFAEFLRQKILLPPTPATKPSLQELASLPLSQRHRVLAPFIADTAEDFKTDSALSEFSALDSEDWEFPDDEP
ncbi:DUF2281 domain-containing protein [Nodosilinea sp. LEGE 07298]|uniref:DUF2281 domain-containing protein n=1 Tax=Nodosilinea sp. LEGE 07298 TaxID=2777970 RepID=UPI00187ECA4E|nr:DUF2281 domain-containing protein [Nodosilinea sp. LEGE 07298]MBE9113318.1 DUF2281 domain-containing protein [Nodosilinea sp. LEGE 07298]